ncbi:NMD3 family protein [uncultured archaeon]|nr:NMD3 family protein [uncultured archaeon]
MCGKADSQAEFLGELCVSCAESRMPDFPAVKVMFCPKCHSLLDRGRKKKDATLSEEVVRLLKLKGKNAVLDEAKGEIEYDAGHGRIKRKVLLLIDKAQCTDCDKAGSQYFEAIIQLRGDGKKVGKMADSLVRKLEKRTFVPKIEELHEGLDIYCGSRNEAISSLNAFSLPYVRTEKLAGQRDGKRLYRTTLLVRL